MVGRAYFSFVSDPAQRPTFAALVQSFEKELGANLQAGTLKLLTQSSAAGTDGRKDWTLVSGSGSTLFDGSGASSRSSAFNSASSVSTLPRDIGDGSGHYYQ